MNRKHESAPVWGNGGSFNRLRNVVEGFGGEPSGSADTNWIFDVAERRPCRKWTPIVARNPNVGGRCERARRSAWSSRQLVFYDDQSMGANVPGIYTKLLDVDKVDLVVSGYGTAIIAPAMPVVMQHGAAFVTLLGSATNAEFKYDRCANVSPVGGKMEEDFAKGFFEIAKGITPRPKTVSIAGLDSDFPMRAMQSARTQAGAAGLSIVYDSAYRPQRSTILRLSERFKQPNRTWSSLPLTPRFDRIAEGRPGIEADRDDAWRRHDWSSGHGHQTATGRIAQQSRLLGCLCARAS